jgi:hypothetical protein
MDNKLRQHWTANGVDDFVFQIASDFALQLEKKLDGGPIKNKELAERLRVSASRVSQVLNTPGNFKLRSMAEYARALGMKVAVVAYDDGDPNNSKGPINSEVFHECWRRMGRPQDFYDLGPKFIVQYGYSQQIQDGTDKDRLGERYSDISLFGNNSRTVFLSPRVQ